MHLLTLTKQMLLPLHLLLTMLRCQGGSLPTDGQETNDGRTDGR